ncbi:hypothetical protein SK128_006636 [Halocaridina rubra]|uniref:Ion transport domain-containing protein n=1 Tax=Halocaridina rubra TaxID=373956 RepID=A0AAN8XDF6_HALRR
MWRGIKSFWNTRTGTLVIPVEEQELETVKYVDGKVNNGRYPSQYVCDVIDEGDIYPVFAAIQQYDIDDLKNLLEENPDLVNETTCGGLAPIHAACHVKNLQILQIVLHYGALVNKFDNVGNTALYISVYEEWHEGILELLKYDASPNIKCHSGVMHSNALIETPLQAAVRKGDLTSTALLLPHNPDLTLCDSNHCTVLHLAAKSLNVELVKRLLKEKACQTLISSIDLEGNSVMHAALQGSCRTCDQHSMKEVIRLLFEAGVNVNSYNHLSESPLFIAARAGLDEAVEFLLMLGSETQILTNRRLSLLHGACISGNAMCLKHLLNNGSLYSFVTQADDNGREPFHYAVLSCSIDCCELLLNSGDHLTRKDENGCSRCSLILEYLPSAAELLEHMFDSGICLSDKPQHDPDFRVCFDYSVIVSPQDCSQSSYHSSLISDLTNNDLTESLLKHPLIESFLFRKWSRIKIFFYMNVFVFFLFLILHSCYIVSYYKKVPMTLSKDITNVWIFRYLHMFMYFVIVVPEVIVTVSHPKRVIRHWESLTKLISLISSAFVVFSYSISDQATDTDHLLTNSTVSELVGNEAASGVETMSFHRQMAAASAFFGWVELMMLFGRFPSLGVYALMLTRIAKSMVLFVLAFATLLIGFAISFMVLFYKKDSFASFFLSLVKTMMMMIGEIDYENLVDDKPPPLGYVMLIAFMFLVCILVVNLLIGLAVNDISNLERLGEIKRLSKQASFLIALERLTSCLRRWNIFPRSVYSLFSNWCDVKPRLYISLNRRRFNTNEKYKIPADIVEAALTIGNSKRESLLIGGDANRTKWLVDKESAIRSKLDNIVEILHNLTPDEVSTKL